MALEASVSYIFKEAWWERSIREVAVLPKLLPDLCRSI
jgi:hypothetical protein